MDSKEVKKIILQEKLIPILRIENNEKILNIADAVVRANCKILELTMTTKNVYNSISAIKSKYPDLLIGLGSVMNEEEAKEGIKHGADFILSPFLNKKIVDVVKRYQKFLILSGFTPTEIYNAYEAGSDIVKLYPASEMQPTFIREFQRPFPNIELMASGGLDLISAIQFIKNGAVAVGLGSTIFKKELIEKENYDAICSILKNAISRVKNMEL